MKLFFSADNDIDLLPFFLDHYRKLGFTEFFCSTNNLKVCDYDVNIVEWEEKEPFFPTWDAAINKMVNDIVGPEEWYGLAELDEFHDYEDVPIGEIIELCEQTKKSHVLGLLKDRVAVDGSLPELRMDVPLGKQFPLVSEISKLIMRACEQKVMLCKGNKQIGGGRHLILDCTECFQRKFSVYHFKWHANVLKRMTEKVAFATDEGSGWIAGNRMALAYWKQHGTVLV